jgi:hypothetical protein
VGSAGIEIIKIKHTHIKKLAINIADLPELAILPTQNPEGSIY